MSGQDSLFEKSDEDLEKDYTKFLEKRGYRVTKLLTTKKSPNIGEVVSYFYDKLEQVSGHRAAAVARLSDSKDFKAVSVFQEKAKKSGINRAMANKVLVDLIDIVFAYYIDTETECNLYNLDYIVSQRGSWVIQKAMRYHKKRCDEFEGSEEAERYRRGVYSDLDSDQFRAIQKLRHDSILEDKETTDGKKEDDEKEGG